MKFAFEVSPAEWVEISEAGTLLVNGGEDGEPVRLSHAFVASLSEPERAARNFIEIAEPDPPEGWIGWTIGDVEGVPTVIWQTEA